MTTGVPIILSAINETVTSFPVIALVRSILFDAKLTSDNVGIVAESSAIESNMYAFPESTPGV